jgi:acyl-CoA thioesterase-1
VPVANKKDYLADIISTLRADRDERRFLNIVCHGHSVPAGYLANPMIDTLNAYPHLLFEGLKHRFPFSFVNVIVTAIGGENSRSGAKRFAEEVLCHRPRLITIDYSLNDRGIGLEEAKTAWVSMIEEGLSHEVKMLLMTPTPDITQRPDVPDEERLPLQEHAQQVRDLAAEYEVGLVDSLAAFEQYQRQPADLTDLLAWRNHPNKYGHAIVVREILRWFPIA